MSEVGEGHRAAEEQRADPDVRQLPKRARGMNHKSISGGTEANLLDVLLPYLHLDRGHARSIVDQLRDGIELAIFSGEVEDGDLLPPVRELARALKVAPNTIFRAYRDLQAAGTIRSIPKHGYFVTIGTADSAGADAIAQIEHLITRAIEVARAANLDPSSVLAAVERITQRRQAASRIVVLGYDVSFLTERVAWVQNALADLDIEVQGVSFECLVEGKISKHLSHEDVYLVPVGDWNTAQTLLGDLLVNVVPMTRDLRPDVRRFIAQQSPETIFGVIESTEDRAGRIVANLRLLHPLHKRPITAVANNTIMTEYTINHADVLLSGGGSQEILAELGPITKPHAQLVSIPDDKTLGELRIRAQRNQE